jgi:hypothetical protein
MYALGRIYTVGGRAVNLEDIRRLTMQPGPWQDGQQYVTYLKREKHGEKDRYKARFISPVDIYHCFGGRDDQSHNRLLTLMMQGNG